MSPGPWRRPGVRPLPAPAIDPTWEKIRQATIDLVLERGLGPPPVEQILERAGISRADFDARFAGADECWDLVYAANMAEFDRALVAPYLAERNWRDAVRAAMRSGTAYVRQHRREVLYEEIHLRSGAPVEQATHDRYLQRVVDLIDAGRHEVNDPRGLTRGTAEGVVGSIYSLLMRRLGRGGGAVASADLIHELMYIAVRPYLGQAAAVEELQGVAPWSKAAA